MWALFAIELRHANNVDIPLKWLLLDASCVMHDVRQPGYSRDVTVNIEPGVFKDLVKR